MSVLPNNYIARTYSRDYKIWLGELVMVFVGHMYKDARMIDNQMIISGYWLYTVQHADGRLTSLVHGDWLSDPGKCAECDGPTVNDYICTQCRSILN